MADKKIQEKKVVYEDKITAYNTSKVSGVVVNLDADENYGKWYPIGGNVKCIFYTLGNKAGSINRSEVLNYLAKCSYQVEGEVFSYKGWNMYPLLETNTTTSIKSQIESRLSDLNVLYGDISGGISDISMTIYDSSDLDGIFPDAAPKEFPDRDHIDDPAEISTNYPLNWEGK